MRLDAPVTAGNRLFQVLPRAVRSATTFSPVFNTAEARALILLVVIYATAAPETLSVNCVDVSSGGGLQRDTNAGAALAYAVGAVGQKVLGPLVAGGNWADAVILPNNGNVRSIPIPHTWQGHMVHTPSPGGAWEYEVIGIEIGGARPGRTSGGALD